MLIIIDNYDSFTYNLYQEVAGTIDTRVFRNDTIHCKDIEAMQPSGIILSPGPGRPEDAGICLELVQQLGARFPILGICLGHQVIAQAYGAQIVQSRQIIHGKTSLVHHLNDALFANMAKSFQAGRYHSLSVDLTTLVADLLVTAVCENNQIMAIRHIAHHNYGVQFHPESILTPEGHHILKNFVRICQKKESTHVDTITQKAAAA